VKGFANRSIGKSLRLVRVNTRRNEHPNGMAIKYQADLIPARFHQWRSHRQIESSCANGSDIRNRFRNLFFVGSGLRWKPTRKRVSLVTQHLAKSLAFGGDRSIGCRQASASCSDIGSGFRTF
jgi:hypothetical protein